MPAASSPDGSRPTSARTRRRAAARSPRRAGRRRPSPRCRASDRRPRRPSPAPSHQWDRWRAAGRRRPATPRRPRSPRGRPRQLAGRAMSIARRRAIARPNQATGCTTVGGSPSQRSASTPTAAAPDVTAPRQRTRRPPVPAGRAGARRRGTCRRGRSWCSRERPRGGPRADRAAATLECTSTQLAAVVDDVVALARQGLREIGADGGHRRRPTGQIGRRQQRLDDGEGEGVHGPERLAPGDRAAPSASGAITYPRRRPGHAHSFVSDPSRQAVSSPRVHVPVASGQNASSHTAATSSVAASWPNGFDGFDRQRPAP